MSDIPKYTVKEFDPDDRPQEKAERLGIQALTLSELWAVILRSGQPGVPITRLTQEMMRKNDNKLKNLERMTRNELMLIPGIGRVKALQIEAVLEIMRRYNQERLGDKVTIKTSSDIFNYMRDLAGRHNQEHIWLLMLSRSNALLSCREISSGGTTATVFDVKSALREVISTPRAEAVIMVHNHPSGTCRPSPQDDRITEAMRQGAEYVGLRMLDHVIVTQDAYYSYSDEGRL